MSDVDRDRYRRAPRWKVLVLGLPWAVLPIAVGGYLTLASWGGFDGGASRSTAFDAAGSIIAGLGVAFGYVCLRRRP